MWKWIRRLQAIPELLVAFAVLRDDVDSTIADPQVRTALDRFRADPVIAPLVSRFSAEWRAFENAVNDLR